MEKIIYNNQTILPLTIYKLTITHPKAQNQEFVIGICNLYLISQLAFNDKDLIIRSYVVVM